MCQKCEGIGLNSFISKNWKYEKNVGAFWKLPTKQHIENWAGLAVLFSRKLPNDFFNIFKFFTYETNETHALAFLKHIILAIGGVSHYGDEGYPIPSKDDYYQQEPSFNVWGVLLPVSSIGAPGNIF